MLPWKPQTLINFTIGLLLLIGTILRFYNFTNTLQFLGDQGRDALIVMHIVKDHHPVLIGPVTSTGNLYLGPLYYYMMAPFLLLTYPSPLGPAYAVAVLAIITLFLTYYLGKELVGKYAALLAMGFFTLSATAITYSRFSWNPNPAPFFSIILLWASHRFWTKNVWYLLLMSFCVSVLIQLHYVTLLAGAGAGVIWLIKAVELFRSSTSGKLKLRFIFATLLSLLIFLLSLTPLALFELRHNFINTHSLQKLLTVEDGGFTQTNNLLKVMDTIRAMHGRGILVLFEMFIGIFRDLNTLLFIVFIVVFFFLAASRHRTPRRTGYQILCIYFLVAIVGLAFYRSTVFYHYVAYLFPVTFLMYGAFFTTVFKHKLGKALTIAFVTGFLVWNALHMPFASMSWTITDIQHGAQTISDRVKPGEKYNLVLLTGTGDIEGQNYRYFLETTDKKPLPKDRWGETETLFIINEDKKLAKVTDSPIYEIVVFPNKQPAEVYTIPNGPEITVLRKK